MMTNQEAPEDWRPDDHPPHGWPIGQPEQWRAGGGCPTVCCKGEGTRREGAAMIEETDVLRNVEEFFNEQERAKGAPWSAPHARALDQGD